jgi:hypothetical protein
MEPAEAAHPCCVPAAYCSVNAGRQYRLSGEDPIRVLPRNRDHGWTAAKGRQQRHSGSNFG